MSSDSAIYVLVVEDEFLSRLHAVSLVEEAGYKAVEASNAEEAIAILEARKDIRIVFTDVDSQAQWMASNSLTPSAHAGPQSSLLSPQGILTCATTCPSVGDFFRNHMVIERSFRPSDALPLRLFFPAFAEDHRALICALIPEEDAYMSAMGH